MASKGRYTKGKKKNGPTLWQIFFSDEEPSKVLANGSARKSGEEVSLRTNPFELDCASISSEEEEVDGATLNGGVRGSAEGDVVIFQKSGNDDNEEAAILQSEYEDNHIQVMDGFAADASFVGKRFLIRTDSDLELALPSTGYQKAANSCRYCCVCCPKWPLWRDYVWLALAAVIFVAIWAGILAAILKGLGGQ